MFSDILKRLTSPAPDPLNTGDARLALTALLVRVARSDGEYAPEEKDRIDLLVEARYGLSPFEASELRKNAETLEAQAPDTVTFTEAIKQAVAYENRLSVIESLWQVALADGQRDAGEDALLRMATKFLGISDVDSARIRQKVEKSI